MPLILYQRDDCHLCDLALDVLAQARVPEFESVFIDGDDVLEARYGIRVPVLHRSDNEARIQSTPVFRTDPTWPPNALSRSSSPTRRAAT